MVAQISNITDISNKNDIKNICNKVLLYINSIVNIDIIQPDKIINTLFDVDNIINILKVYTDKTNKEYIDKIYKDLKKYIFDKDIQIISDYIIYNNFKKQLENEEKNNTNNYYFENIKYNNVD